MNPEKIHIGESKLAIVNTLATFSAFILYLVNGILYPSYTSQNAPLNKNTCGFENNTSEVAFDMAAIVVIRNKKM